MRIRRSKNPNKKTDTELYNLIIERIRDGDYVFLTHAKQRLIDRNILDIDVISILEGRKGYSRKRNKSKDKYENGMQDWNYCFEGCNADSEKIRIIISFDNNLLLLIITVIKLTK